MAKLAKWKLVSELVEQWSQQDRDLREYIAKGLMDEYERQYAACGLPTVDWDFMHMGQAAKQRNFDIWFDRVAKTFLNSKSDAWLRAQHKQDVLGV
jgi:hypothetical protein